METKKQKINLKSIPEDQAVQITIGGIFYQRLNKLLIDYCDSVDQKELLIAMSKVKLNKYLTNDKFAFNLETLLILLRAIEERFHEEGYAVENEVEIDVPLESELPKEEDLEDTED